MQIGICGSLDQMDSVADAGADFIEANIRALTVPEHDAWAPPTIPNKLLPVPTANSFIAPEIRLTGNDVNEATQQAFVERVLSRAAETDVRLIVFGSGGARNVPDGFSHERAYEQLISFSRRAAVIAATHGITIVVEPLNRGECNVINTLGRCGKNRRCRRSPEFAIAAGQLSLLVGRTIPLRNCSVVCR